MALSSTFNLGDAFSTMNAQLGAQSQENTRLSGMSSGMTEEGKASALGEYNQAQQGYGQFADQGYWSQGQMDQAANSQFNDISKGIGASMNQAANAVRSGGGRSAGLMALGGLEGQANALGQSQQLKNQMEMQNAQGKLAGLQGLTGIANDRAGLQAQTTRGNQYDFYQDAIGNSTVGGGQDGNLGLNNLDLGGILNNALGVYGTDDYRQNQIAMMETQLNQANADVAKTGAESALLGTQGQALIDSTASQVGLNEAQAGLYGNQGNLLNSQAENLNALTPGQVEAQNVENQLTSAQAGLTTSQTENLNALTPGQVANQEAINAGLLQQQDQSGKMFEHELYAQGLENQFLPENLQANLDSILANNSFLGDQGTALLNNSQAALDQATAANTIAEGQAGINTANANLLQNQSNLLGQLNNEFIGYNGPSILDYIGNLGISIG